MKVLEAEEEAMQPEEPDHLPGKDLSDGDGFDDEPGSSDEDD
jgi:hypothetical protein